MLIRIAFFCLLQTVRLSFNLGTVTNYTERLPEASGRLCDVATAQQRQAEKK